MQVDKLKLNDFIGTSNKTSAAGADIITDLNFSDEKMKKSSESLRSISLPISGYNDINEAKSGDKIADKMDLDSDATIKKNAMVIASHTMSKEDFAKAAEEGYKISDMQGTEIVTVTDKIKVALAMGGADISSFGGIDDAAIEDVYGGNVVDALKASFDENAVDYDDGYLKEAAAATEMMSQLTEPLSNDSINYLVENELEPTVENVHKAYFATPSIAEGVIGNSIDISVTDESLKPELVARVSDQQVQNALDDLENQLKNFLNNNDISSTNENLAVASDLIKNGIEINKNNVEYKKDLSSMSLPISNSDMIDILDAAALEGRNPKDAIILPERSEALAVIKEIRASISLSETSIIMNARASYAMSKYGVDYSAKSAEDALEALRNLEKEFVAKMLGEDSFKTASSDVISKVDSYLEVSDVISDVKNANAGYIGVFANTHLSASETITFRQISVESKSYTLSASDGMASQVTSATAEYEKLWTAPRSDMGDSITKAFANVDDILDDLGLEVNAINERAVRILSYNQTEITISNIDTVKSIDSSFARMLDALKPATVLEMIKDGINPLDKSLEELTKIAEGYNLGADANAESDDFAKFLWKTEHADGLSEDERNAYIGLYRLIHQVEKSDGAQIGALIAADMPVTLRNLLSATRTSKKKGMDYSVDDDFGGVDAKAGKTLSISQQIEKVFETNSLIAAGNKITPEKLSTYKDENSYLDMKPSEFNNSLDALMTEEVLVSEDASEEEYYGELRQQMMNQEFIAEQELYEILTKADLQTTPSNIMSLWGFMSDKNSVYKNLMNLSKDEDDELDLSKAMAKLIEDFGEAAKTPKEMAEAQEKLADVAENVMRTMITERRISSRDMRDMKLVMNQVKMLGELGEKTKEYHVPIAIENSVGDMQVKIVNAEEKKGLVDISFDLETTGVVVASFKYEGEKIIGNVEAERTETFARLDKIKELIADNIKNATNIDAELNLANRYSAGNESNFTIPQNSDNEISSAVLLSVASSFMKSIKEF